MIRGFHHRYWGQTSFQNNICSYSTKYGFVDVTVMTLSSLCTYSFLQKKWQLLWHKRLQRHMWTNSNNGSTRSYVHTSNDWHYLWLWAVFLSHPLIVWKCYLFYFTLRSWVTVMLHKVQLNFVHTSILFFVNMSIFRYKFLKSQFYYSNA